MTDLLDLRLLSAADLRSLYRLTDRVKANPGEFRGECSGQTLLLLFANPSTRTRLSLQVGATELGGEAIYLDADTTQLSRGERVADTARVVSRYVDAVAARFPDHGDLRALADDAEVPVINALTDRFHPCQALADLYTLRELDRTDHPVAFVGDGNNVAQSLMLACGTLGVECRVATHEGYEPETEVREAAGSTVSVCHDPEAAVDGAGAVYTDVFESMHHDRDGPSDFEGFQVTADLMDGARSDAVFMHCLPAHRGEEVTAAVVDSPRSVVFDQAENRLHVQKALLSALL